MQICCSGLLWCWTGKPSNVSSFASFPQSISPGYPGCAKQTRSRASLIFLHLSTETAIQGIHRSIVLAKNRTVSTEHIYSIHSKVHLLLFSSFPFDLSIGKFQHAVASLWWFASGSIWNCKLCPRDLLHISPPTDDPLCKGVALNFLWQNIVRSFRFQHENVSKPLLHSDIAHSGSCFEAHLLVFVEHVGSHQIPNLFVLADSFLCRKIRTL